MHIQCSYRGLLLNPLNSLLHSNLSGDSAKQPELFDYKCSSASHSDNAALHNYSLCSLVLKINVSKYKHKSSRFPAVILKIFFLFYPRKAKIR